MRRSFSLILAILLVSILVIPAMVLGAPGKASANPVWNYTGMGPIPLTLTYNGSNIFAGCSNGHVYVCSGGPWSDTGVIPNAESPVWSIAYGGGTLYAGCYNGHVYALDAGTWSDTGDAGAGMAITSLLYSSGTIYAGGYNGHLYGSSGGGAWSDLGNPGGSISSLTHNGAVLYEGNWNGHVYSLTGATWHDEGNPGSTSTVSCVAFGGGTLYAGSYDCSVYELSGGSWSNIGGAGGSVMNLLYGGSILYAIDSSGFVSKWDGSSWSETGTEGNMSGACSFTYNGSTLYAGCQNGHVFSYRDASWSDIGTPSGLSMVNCLASGAGTLYAGCADGHVADYVHGGWILRGSPGGGSPIRSMAYGTKLYAGCDNGHVYSYASGSWSNMGTPGAGSPVNSLASDGTNIYAGCNDGSVRTYDGSTWVDTSIPDGGSPVLSLAYGDSSVAAGCSNGHVYSYDGSTWFDTGQPASLAVTSVVYAGTIIFATATDGHVHRYHNSWTDTGAPGAGSLVSCLASSGSAVYAGCGNGHVYVYGYDLSTSWSDTATVPGGSTVLSLAYNGSTLYTGCDSGHVYAYSSGTWTDTEGPGVACTTALTYCGSMLYAGCDNGHVYGDVDGTWTDTEGPASPGTAVKALASNGSTLYAGCANAHVYSYSYGSWTDLGTIPSGGAAVTTMVFGGSTLYAGSARGRVYAYNGGTWSTLGDPGGENAVYSMTYKNYTLYAAVDGGHVWGYSGGTWFDMGCGNSSSTLPWSIAFNGNTLYAGCDDGHVYAYSGGSWSDAGLPTGYAGVPIFSLVSNGSTLYAGTWWGHVYSYRGGSWTDSGGPCNWQEAAITALAYNGNTLAAGSWGGGVYTCGGVRPTEHRVTATATGHGMVSPGVQTVNDGMDATVNITPSPGWRIDSVTDNSNGVTPGATYTMTGVTEDHAIQVVFSQIVTHSVTATTTSGHGSVSPGAQTIDDGTNATITIRPDIGYRTAAIFDNTNPETIGPTYTINNVTIDHNVVVTFNPVSTHRVTASSGAHGSVSPGAQTVNDSEAATVTITPDIGYQTDTVQDNATPVLPVPAGSYTIPSVTSNHAVTATFSPASAYTITGSGNYHGSVSPGTQSINQHGNATVTFAADDGYCVSSVTDNGTGVSPTTPTSYTISNVTASHSVFVNFAEAPTYNVSACAPGGQGTVSPGSQTINEHGDATVTFTPDVGGQVLSVTDNAVPVTPVPTTSYAIHDITSDHAVQVTFSQVSTSTHMVTASSSGGHGTVSPGTQSADNGASATINISPDVGYRTASIRDNEVSEPVGPTYTITNVTADHNVVVTFSAVTTYRVYTMCSGHGTVTPGTQSVNSGGSASITITPDVGYQTTRVRDNGHDITPIPSTCTITNVVVSHLVEVTFSAVPTYTVSASSSTGHGSVSPGSQTINQGASATITIAADIGYQVLSVSDNGTTVSPPPTTSYTITNVIGGHSVDVTFTSVPTWTVTASISGGHGSVAPGSLTVNNNANAVVTITPSPGWRTTSVTDNGNPVTAGPPTYTISGVTMNHAVLVTFSQIATNTVTASAPAGHGTITPGTQTVNDGNNASVTITPDIGYRTSSVTDNGSTVTPASTYTIAGVTADHSVVVAFTQVTAHRVTAAVSSGPGNISPGLQMVDDGATAVITLAPNSGCCTASVTDNSSPVVPVPTTSYTINNVTSDHAVQVTFAHGVVNTLTVTASAPLGHGTVSPGSQTVARGSNATVTITPNTGYRTASVTDNGILAAPVPTTSYALRDVTANHQVVVAFTRISTVATGSSFYFAEGTTRDNFAEYLCIGNPNEGAATAKVTYLFSDGTTRDASYTVPANSRYTVNVNSVVGPGKDLSLKVASDTGNLVAERPMYFNYNGAWTGGSDAVGAVAPATRWYFAEGTTLAGFDQYLTVLNPGSATADLKFHYMIEGSGEKVVTGQVNAHSRATFKTADQVGPDKNLSLFLESDANVVAERPMYFNYQGLASNNWTGGHDVVGTNSPARSWYLAEGTTRAGFEQWLCLENPSASAVTVKATYQLGAGQGDPVVRSYVVPAQQRLTVSVNKELGPEKDCSVLLTAASDFIAERPMYFNYHGKWSGGHDVLGANGAATTWFFAEGSTRAGFDEWLCLQNPGGSAARVNITWYPASGKPIVKSYSVAPNSRLTVNVNADAGANLDMSCKCASDKPVIVERPMYFDYNGWTGGHDVVGFVPATR